MSDLEPLYRQLALSPCVLVTVLNTEGSAPRERGAWMAVWPDLQLGTIGGGHLEWDALRHSRARLSEGGDAGTVAWTQTVKLGPTLGQCCGGVMQLGFEWLVAADIPALRLRLTERHMPLAIFGGGHVGRAIVQALAPLPFDVRWIDSRDEVFPPGLAQGVSTEHSDPVHAAVADLVPGTAVLIMSFSHAEDLDIVAACLQRLRRSGDLRFVGLIGSRTKWATFRRRLVERGFAQEELGRITCPIGLPGLEGKEPAVIAASVVAQLLLTRFGSREPAEDTA
ncbi:xanthine dehydrogenase accessory protein XdhC [Hydrogenophaga crassostreae]|uniref:Xanthine dehydrogenase accessory protein XdhC n=1 Tax=Hydrogenophaga crassostreae TaxID=1763535 RepID=A0A167IZ25_9BURK|nr:xanthine dehydrogenase accessory protein XdhC [Hydrogenophaga crassostreae]AOW15732.1 xanthine dehydrogenase accessory protein XdhC [Hydrogenophaga crassostreae]OAD43830.1 xanthine dehydrogenase accessory protein XdhC [Hydrogenophaga crassostreae]